MRVLHKLFAFVAIVFYLLSPGAVVFAQSNGFSQTATTTSSGVTCKLSLSATSIATGGSAKLSWTSTHATGGAIIGIGNVATSGVAVVHPTQTTTYVGSFTGTNGTANCSITLRVGSVSSGGASYGTQSGMLGGSTGTQSASQGGTRFGTQNATLGSSNAGGASNAGSGGSGSNTSSGGSGFRLVPCGYGSFHANDTSGSATDQNSTGCQACSLAQLVQNIINFLIGLSIPIAAALFAWAGVLYFTSAGDHHKLEQAKGIFNNAFIGFVIVITAWLVINTLLHVIFQQGEFSGGNWFTIQCSVNRPISGSIGGILSSVLGSSGVTTLSTNGTQSTGSAGSPVYSCSAGATLEGTGDQAFCINSNGSIVNPTCASGYTQLSDGSCMNNVTGNTANVGDLSTITTSCPTGSTLTPTDNSGGSACISDTTGQIVAAESVPGSPSQMGVGDCSPSAMSSFGSNANTMSCVTQVESGCNPTIASSVDVGTDGQAVSYGLYQINISSNSLTCNGQTYNCPSAFSAPYVANNANGTHVINQSLYTQCVSLAQNLSCSQQAALSLYNQNGMKPWTGDNAKCGF